MRRSLRTHLSGHGTLKDTQGALRHASITTTGNVYVQVVEDNVMRAVNSHASTVLEGWRPEVESMGVTGRNVKRLPEPLTGSGSSLTKFDGNLERRFRNLLINMAPEVGLEPTTLRLTVGDFVFSALLIVALYCSYK